MSFVRGSMDFQIDFPRGIERGKGQSKAKLIEFGNLVGDHPTLFFMKRLGAGKERCRVSIRTQPEKDHVETGKAARVDPWAKNVSVKFARNRRRLLPHPESRRGNGKCFLREPDRYEKASFSPGDNCWCDGQAEHAAHPQKSITSFPRENRDRRDLPPAFGKAAPANRLP